MYIIQFINKIVQGFSFMNKTYLLFLLHCVELCLNPCPVNPILKKIIHSIFVTRSAKWRSERPAISWLAGAAIADRPPRYLRVWKTLRTICFSERCLAWWSLTFPTRDILNAAWQIVVILVGSVVLLSTFGSINKAKQAPYWRMFSFTEYVTKLYWRAIRDSTVKWTKTICGRGFAPNPTAGAYDNPPEPLIRFHMLLLFFVL